MNADHRRPPSPFQLVRSTHGITLIELMIVVSIVGVLAAIAGVSYTRYVVQGKVTEMSQWAIDIARGQEQYYSRNGRYLLPDTPQYTSSLSGDALREWTNLLEFDANVPATITIEVFAGIGSDGDCAPCGEFDSPDGMTTGQAWFGILVTDDELDRAVFFNDSMRRPIEIREE